MAQTTVTDREVRFRDGLGVRVAGADHAGDAIEQLRVSAELAVQESAIRERIGRLINFRHVKYVRLRGVDRLKQGGKELVISYDAIDGDRLSTIIETAAKLPLSIDVDVALQVVRDLLPGICILHDSRKVTHGAIAPERLIYTAQHRLIIVDHGFGLALGKLNQPRKKLWEQYRIAVPSSGRAVFDERTDVVQIGMVALSTLLGRPLADDEYPGQLKRLVLSVKEHSSKHGVRPVSPELRQWLERALSIDEEHAFKTVREAQDAFETLVTKGRYAPSAAAVKAFLTRYREQARGAAAVEAGTASTSVDRALQEFAITIGPKVPVRAKATKEPDAPPVVPVASEPASQPVPSELSLSPLASSAPEPRTPHAGPLSASETGTAAPAPRTLVVSSAIDGHTEPASGRAESMAGSEPTEAPRPRESRKGERQSDAPQGRERERVGDAARRARHSPLRSDPARSAASPPVSPAANTSELPRRSRGRLDALKALEEELTRLAAIDLVMPRKSAPAPASESASAASAPPAPVVEATVDAAASHEAASHDAAGHEAARNEAARNEEARHEALEATSAASGPAVVDALTFPQAHEAAPVAPEELTRPVETAAMPITSAHVDELGTPPASASIAEHTTGIEPIVASLVPIEASASIETAAPIEAGTVPEADVPVEPIVGRVHRPLLANDIDAELARLMGQRDPDECAIPIWTIEPSESSPTEVNLQEARNAALAESAESTALAPAREASGPGPHFAPDAGLLVVSGERESEPVAEVDTPIAFAAWVVDDGNVATRQPSLADLTLVSSPPVGGDALETGRASATEHAMGPTTGPADQVVFALEDGPPSAMVGEESVVRRADVLTAFDGGAPTVEPHAAFQLTPPALDAGVLLGGFELTPPPPVDEAPVERPRLLELSTFEQMAADAYEAAEAQLTTRQTDRLIFEVPVAAAPLEVVSVVGAAPSFEDLADPGLELVASASLLQVEAIASTSDALAVDLSTDAADVVAIDFATTEMPEIQAPPAADIAPADVVGSSPPALERPLPARDPVEPRSVAEGTAPSIEVAEVDAAAVDRVESALAIELAPALENAHSADLPETVATPDAVVAAECQVSDSIDRSVEVSEPIEAASVERAEMALELAPELRTANEERETRNAEESVESPAVVTVGESKSRRKRSRRRNKRRNLPVVAPVQSVAEVAPTPATACEVAPAIAASLEGGPLAEARAETGGLAAPAPAAEGSDQPASDPSIADAPAVAAPLETVPFFELDSSQLSEAIPAWARGTAHSDAQDATAVEVPQPIGTVQFQVAPVDPSRYAPSAQSPYVPAWQNRAEPHSLPTNVVPFQPAVDAHRAGTELAPVPLTRTFAGRPPRRFRINWARTLAASLVVALLEGVAFAAALWYVTPAEPGWLTVHTKPTGIEISVDGMPQGLTPLATPLKPGRHTIELRQGTAARVLPVEISAGVRTEQRITWGAAFKTGQARITSSPAGARVSIDGKAHGATPVTVSELSAGKHSVTVEASSGSVTATLIVEPGETTELDVPVFSGWISVLAPVDLEIFERGRLLGTTEAEKLMLSPGPHKLELVNAGLGYRGTQTVDVRPGATTSVSVLPKAEITVEGPDGVELFIDGDRVGQLPLARLKAVIGTREIVFVHPEQGERRQVVIVTMTTPVTVKY